MGFALYWDDSLPNVLHYEFPERWTWDDLAIMRKQIDPTIENRPHPGPVHFIVNMSGTTMLPFGAIGRARIGIENRPKDVVHVYMVGMHALPAAMIRTFQRIYPELGRFVSLYETVDDARVQIRQHLSRSNL